jgi:hypothetical protein
MAGMGAQTVFASLAAFFSSHRSRQLPNDFANASDMPPTGDCSGLDIAGDNSY